MVAIEGHVEAMRRAYDRDLVASYNTARLSRAKRFPSLKNLLQRSKPPPKVTPQEARAELAKAEAAIAAELARNSAASQESAGV